MKDDSNNYFKAKMRKFNQSSFRLTDVTDLSQGEHPEILLDLIPLYQSEFFIESAIASILNAILTHRKAVFLKSTSDIKDLINKDPNRKSVRTDVSSKERNRIIAALKDQFVDEIAPGTSAPNIPAIWQVTDKRMLEFLCQELNLSEADLIEHQSEPILEWRADVENRFQSKGRNRQSDQEPAAKNIGKSSYNNNDDDDPPPRRKGFRRE